MSNKPTYEELEEIIKGLEKKALEHNKAEIALKDSERNLKCFIDNFPGIAFICEPKKCVLYANKALADMYDRTPEEIIGLDFKEFVPPDFYSKIIEQDRIVVEENRTFKIEESVHLETGLSEWITFKFPIVKEGKSTLLGGFGINITERKNVEIALRESEERFRHAFENANDGVCLVGTDGGFIKVNKMMCDIFGYSKNELEAMTVNDITHPEDEDVSPKFIKKSLTGEVQSSIFEKRYYHKNGKLIWGQVSSSVIKDEKGDPLYFISHVQDITKRKQAEEALQESELQFKSTFEQAAVGICHADPSGRFLKINQRFLEIVGHTGNEMGGQTWQSITHPDDLNADLEKVEQVLKNRLKTYTMEKRFIKKDGVIVWVNLTVSLVRKPDGSPHYFIGVIEDLSERKKMEAQLQQIQKMESIGTLAGGIAHDFNNILGIILGNAELAMDDVPDWNPSRQNLDEIRKACLRAKDVVRQILSFSRKAEIKQKPFNIASVVVESIKLLRASIPTSIEIRRNIAYDVDDILGDPTQIHQLMINLSTNAAHAMENDGGILDVILGNTKVDEDTALQHPELNPGPHVHLRVRDTGDGIKPEIVDRVFDPYFTTKDVGKGTGMGLAVVHGIVKSHRGTISVDSETGKGATFNILFPSIEREIKDETKAFQELPTGNEKILFVDDEDTMVNLNQQRLERLGYKVTPRTDPSEALEYVHANPDQIDLVITDMTMPKMTGDRLAQEILKIRPDMPIILCTGYSERMSENNAQEIGIRKYIEKPIEKVNLARSIREVLDGK